MDCVPFMSRSPFLHRPLGMVLLTSQALCLLRGNDEGSPNGADHTLADRSPAGASTYSNLDSGPKAISKKQHYKHGWSKEEHFLILRCIRAHDRGSWKQISKVVQSRNAKQVKSHAQKFFHCQQQNNKKMGSIQHLTLYSREMQELGN